MAVLDKYKVSKAPPEITRARAKRDPMEKVNRNFLKGLEKQVAQAKAWKPGARDLRSWVTRDEAKGEAWITVKYGPWPVPIKGTSKSTIGPVKLGEIPKVFEDIRKAHQSSELEAALKKVAFKGPRKKARKRSANRKRKGE